MIVKDKRKRLSRKE